MSNDLFIVDTKTNLRFLIRFGLFCFVQIASSDSGFNLDELDDDHKLNDGRSHVNSAPDKSPERVDQANDATSAEVIFSLFPD